MNERENEHMAWKKDTWIESIFFSNMLGFEPFEFLYSFKISLTTHKNM